MWSYGAKMLRKVVKGCWIAWTIDDIQVTVFVCQVEGESKNDAQLYWNNDEGFLGQIEGSTPFE